MPRRQGACVLTDMPVEIGRIVLLFAWFFVGLFLAQKYAPTKLVPGHLKAISTVLLLLIGPPYFLALVALFVLETRRGGGMSVWDAIRMATGMKPGSSDPFGSEADSRSSVMLLDTSGRSLAEVYSRSAEDAEVLTLTSEIVGEAVADLASDILIQPTSSAECSVRFRVDGQLRVVHQLDVRESNAVINSIKAISGMDIAERRRPQDGKFVARTPGGHISFRVATAGVMYGEKISIRVLDQSATNFGLKDVGFTKGNYDHIRKQMAASSGMILVCGPTGSGKSTSLHAMLREIDFSQRNVITIEDPIEYILPEASQIEINDKAGITFSKTLRSVLRQDPDVISIGEIRDAETAEIALQASQTGHLVLATLHASSNHTGILRLIDLGIRPFVIASALNIVISQRLVRKLCSHCKVTANLSAKHHQKLVDRKLDPTRVKQPRGCPRCKGTGYRGRTGVFDVMVISDELKSRLAANDFSSVDGGRSKDANTQRLLHKNATRLALAGITSLEEANKIAATKT